MIALTKFTVHLFMKSGNKVVLKNVKTFNIKKEACQVNSVEWELWDRNAVQILNINVDQIEAVVAYKKFRIPFFG